MLFPAGQAGCRKAILTVTLPHVLQTKSPVLGPPKMASGIPSTKERSYFPALGEENTAQLQAEVGSISWTIWGKSLSLLCFPV